MQNPRASPYRGLINDACDKNERVRREFYEDMADR